jgi:hypothetical protein
MSIAKARTLKAKFQALTTASEMIRSHGEEGFSYQDKEFQKVYEREKLKLSAKLDKMSFKYENEFRKLNIEVNTDIDQEYY